MEVKHTPGPWRAVAHSYPIADTGDYDGAWLVLPNGDRRPIVEIWGDDDKDEANARLIAAAPELLKALRQLKMWLPIMTHMANMDPDGTQVEFSEFEDGRPPETISIASSLLAAEAAIAKATGGAA